VEQKRGRTTTKAIATASVYRFTKDAPTTMQFLVKRHQERCKDDGERARTSVVKVNTTDGDVRVKVIKTVIDALSRVMGGTGGSIEWQHKSHGLIGFVITSTPTETAMFRATMRGASHVPPKININLIDL
jgi:hypothetical protein